VRATFVPEVDEAGETAGFFVLVEDLTDLMAAGSDLRSALDRLSTRVDEYVAITDMEAAQPPAPAEGGRLRPLPPADMGPARADERLARRIVESVPALMVATDARGVVVLFNRACEWLTGCRREDVIGRPLVEALVPPAWRAVAGERLASSGAEALRRPITFPLRTAAGQHVPVLWRFALLALPGREEAGRLGIGFAAGRDSPGDRRRDHRQDHRFARRLRHYAVSEVTAALIHELSQPLSAVLGFTQGALRMLARDGGASREVVDSLEKAAAQAQRLGEIVRLARRQVRSDADPPARQPASIAVVVDQVARRLAAAAADAGVDLRIAVDEALPPVHCDPDAIDHVLTSIVGDSIDAIDGHGDGWVRIRAARLQDAIEIAITDSGPGIAHLVAGRLFDPFVGGKLTGTGLGLAVCRTIVRDNGGEMWLDEQECGSMFRLRLPCPLEESSDVA
jgi:PAS domain S-box-containing protein